jgi:stage III sporulation protein AB
VWGVYSAEVLSKRVDTLSLLYCLLNDYSISIQYTATTVWQLLEDSYHNPQFKRLYFLKVFSESVDGETPFETLRDTSIKRDNTLRPPERDILYGVGSSLGKVGCDECISSLHLAMDRLRLLHTQAVDEYTKKGNLFRWLGVLSGVGIALVLA